MPRVMWVIKMKFVWARVTEKRAKDGFLFSQTKRWVPFFSQTKKIGSTLVILMVKWLKLYLNVISLLSQCHKVKIHTAKYGVVVTNGWRMQLFPKCKLKRCLYHWHGHTVKYYVLRTIQVATYHRWHIQLSFSSWNLNVLGDYI